MRRLALIVEGYGDDQAFPALVARIGGAFGVSVIAPNPIRTGGFHRLVRPGEIERFVEMAARRPDIDSVLVAVDLDDGCPVEASSALLSRVKGISDGFGKDIKICLAIREYECWLLAGLNSLKTACPEYDWDPLFVCRDPSSIRGAKGALEQAMRRRYRPTVDQVILTKKLDPREAFINSRSFRKFVKDVMGVDYADLESSCV